MILNKEIIDKVDFRVSAELSAQVPREQGARQPALGCATATEVKELWPQHPILVSSMGLVASGIFTHVLYGLGKLRLEHAKTVTLRFWVTRCLPVGELVSPPPVAPHVRRLRAQDAGIGGIFGGREAFIQRQRSRHTRPWTDRVRRKMVRRDE